MLRKTCAKKYQYTKLSGPLSVDLWNNIILPTLSKNDLQNLSSVCKEARKLVFQFLPLLNEIETKIKNKYLYATRDISKEYTYEGQTLHRFTCLVAGISLACGAISFCNERHQLSNTVSALVALGLIYFSEKFTFTDRQLAMLRYERSKQEIPHVLNQIERLLQVRNIGAKIKVTGLHCLFQNTDKVEERCQYVLTP